MAMLFPGSGTARTAGERALQETAAEAILRDSIERRLGGSSLIFNEIDCSRVSRGVYRCRAGFFVGDALWEGVGSVRRRHGQGGSRYAFRLLRAKRLCKGVDCRDAVRWCSADRC